MTRTTNFAMQLARIICIVRARELEPVTLIRAIGLVYGRMAA